MKVLVVAASKHGSTNDIAQKLGEVLTGHGHEVLVTTPTDLATIDGFEAFVIGSAVYAGHWLKEAVDLVRANAEVLASRPVWLFSSGPVGDPPKPETDPVEVAELGSLTRARGHQLLAGLLDKSRLGFAEKAIVAALRIPYGDFRSWDVISRWAGEIAADLSESSLLTAQSGSDESGKS